VASQKAVDWNHDFYLRRDMATLQAFRESATLAFLSSLQTELSQRDDLSREKDPLIPYKNDML
jgi:hypothetical protein